MRLLPPSTIPGRIIAISVRAARDSQSESTIYRLLERYHVPATWAFDDAAAAKAFLRTAKAEGHEVAAHHNGEAGPELLAVLRRFRQTGLGTSTLLSHGEPAGVDFGRLVREGINLVALDGVLPNDCEPVATLRFGLWRLATSYEIPGREGWLRSLWTAGSGRRQVDQAIRRQQLLHVCIDEVAAANHGRATRTLERLLRHVDRRRQQGLLEVATLNDIARQLERPPAAATAQSILRARAA